MPKNLYKMFIVFIAVLFLSGLFLVDCSSSSGGDDDDDASWNSGEEDNPTTTMVDAAGNVVTSIAPSSPLVASATGLLANGVYRASIIDPNGSALYDENPTLVTDGDGNLSATAIAFFDPGADIEGTYTIYLCKSTEATCDASTASTTSTITVSFSQSYVFSADSSGSSKNSFLNGLGDVYAVVANGPANTTIGLRVVENSFAAFSDGDELADDASGAVTTCVTDAGGACSTTLVWENVSATITDAAALYDIVADVGNDGSWNEGTDFMDSLSYVAGFTVQQESEASGAASVAALASGSNVTAEIACSDVGAPLAIGVNAAGYCTHFQVFHGPAGMNVFGFVNPADYVEFLRSGTNVHVIGHKYIILHDDNLSYGDPLTPIGDLGYDLIVDTLQPGCLNELKTLLWPRQTFVPGCYDVVIDINKNGVLDAGEPIDGYSGQCGFITTGGSGAPEVTIIDMLGAGGTSIGGSGSTTSSSVVRPVATVTGSPSACYMYYWHSQRPPEIVELDTSWIDSSGQMIVPEGYGANTTFFGNYTIVVTCISGSTAGADAGLTKFASSGSIAAGADYATVTRSTTDEPADDDDDNDDDNNDGENCYCWCPNDPPGVGSRQDDHTDEDSCVEGGHQWICE